MIITPVRTGLIEAFSADITKVLEDALSRIPENSVIAITSKVISLCEGNVVKQGDCNKDEIIKREADLFLPKGGSKYGVYLTIKNNILIANSGVDESNTGGYYVLWPKAPQESARRCWQFVRERFGIKNLGIVITDSSSAPLRWGVTGTCIAHCGFNAVNSKVGTSDLFGRELKMTKANVANALAAAAVLCMGEADEGTPVALLEDLPFVDFRQEPPSQEELESLKIDMRDDLYGQLITSTPWQPGKK